MSRKKADKAATDPQQKALEHKIDELLSLEPVAPLEPTPEAPKTEVKTVTPHVTAAPVPADTSEPIDIFKGLSDVPAVVATPESETPEQPADTTPEPVLSVPQPTPTVAPESTVDLDDAEVEKAVDEILVAEGDALLAAEDVAAKYEPHPNQAPKSSGFIKKLFK